MTKHIHILGICGTFMGGLALLARELGFKVTGSDANVYPPMSEQLQAAGIRLSEGYLPEHLQPAPDCVVVGNALSRGNAAVEYMLDQGLPYTSGPQWLAEHVLHGRWVLAVAGTHGKTTSSALLAWMLEQAGLAPGFLIGGVPANFGCSARLGGSDFFVIEADEYDTAFFDKRSKFVHYRPRTLCINNLEYDHADIFSDLAAIQRQFHHLLRCVPANGLVVVPKDNPAIEAVLAMGCWTETETFTTVGGDADWRGVSLADDASQFRVDTATVAVEARWQLCGLHNVENLLSAMAAAHHVGVTPELAAQSVTSFKGVKRRQQLIGEEAGVYVYDDFAHHPTAIARTLEGFSAANRNGRVIAVIEPRSNTMRKGEHREQLAEATAEADRVYWYQPAGLDWSLESVLADSPVPASLHNELDQLVAELAASARVDDRVIIMSNGSFGGIHQKLLRQLETGTPCQIA